MLDYLEQVLDARSVEQVWDLHLARMTEYGFDRLIYGVTYETGRDGFGQPDDLMVLSNLPDAYLERYIGEGLYLHATMTQWLVENTGAMSWSWARARERALSERAHEVLALNQRFKVTAGISISFGATPPCGRSAMALIARKGLDQNAVDAIWDLHGRTIELMNRVAHLRITALPRDTLHRVLTPRQRQVLKLMGSGHTVQDVATQIGISRVTVEKHLRLAREQLGAETTAQAVLKAAVQNHIYLPG